MGFGYTQGRALTLEIGAGSFRLTSAGTVVFRVDSTGNIFAGGAIQAPADAGDLV